MSLRIPKAWAPLLDLLGAAGLLAAATVVVAGYTTRSAGWALENAPALGGVLAASLAAVGLRAAVHFGSRAGRVRFLSRREERRLTGGRLALGEATALRPSPADRPKAARLPFSSAGRAVGGVALALWLPAAAGAFVDWPLRHYVALAALLGSIAVGLIWLGSQAARFARMNSGQDEP